MRYVTALLALALGLSPLVVAETPPVPRYVVYRTAAAFTTGTCTQAMIGIATDTGRTYTCSPGSAWAPRDLPMCPANPPTGACQINGSDGAACVRSDTGAIYACISNVWTATGATLSGSTGQVPYISASGVLTGAPGMVLTGSGTILTDSLRQRIIDLTGSGTWITRTMGDKDGDGTLSFAKDVKTIIDADQALSARCDLDGDGTNESLCIKYKFPAGQWKFGFRDTVTLSKGGVVFQGEGAGSTFFTIVGSCNGSDDYDGDGTVDSLDNGDITQDYRSTFILNASNIVFSDLSFDGKSDQYSFSQLASTDSNYCDPNDTDGDGSAVAPIGTDYCPCDPAHISAGTCTQTCAAIGAPASKAGGQACGSSGRTWCPNDEHFWFNSSLQTPSAGKWTWANDAFRRSDSNIWELDQPGTDMLIANCTVYGSGEQSLQVFSNSRVESSHFERCSAGNAECITLTSPDYDADGTYDSGDDLLNVAIIGNNFKDCGGACVNATAPTIGDKTLKRIKIESNVVDNTTLGTTNKGVFVIQAASTGTATFDDISISNNTIKEGSTNGMAIFLSTGASVVRFNGPRISGNQISGVATSASGARVGIDVVYANDAVISGNKIDLTADGTATSGNEEQCILVSTSTAANVSNNVCKMTAASGGVIGINFNTVTGASATSNVFDFTGVTLSANLEEGMRLQGTSSRNVISGNTISGGDRFALNASGDNNFYSGNNCYNTAQCIYMSSGKANRLSGNHAYLQSGQAWTDITGVTDNWWDANDCTACTANAPYGGWDPRYLGMAWVTDIGGDGTLDAASYSLFGATTTQCWEGTTWNGIHTCLAVVDPTTSNKTITLPNATGTVALSSGAAANGGVALWTSACATTCTTICANVGLGCTVSWTGTDWNYGCGTGTCGTGGEVYKFCFCQ